MAKKKPSQATEAVHRRIDELKPHPGNYRKHPPDQLAHLVESIREHGFYRNVVIASDDVILAGHGAVEAAKQAGRETVPCYQLAIDSKHPKALKVLAGDNEVGRLAEIDDRALSMILKDIKDSDDIGLLGTGYDEAMLANLVMVTRPASEIATINEAAEWVGMPDYDEEMPIVKVIVSFDSEEDRQRFMDQYKLGNNVMAKTAKCWSLRWPSTERDDLRAVRFQS